MAKRFGRMARAVLVAVLALVAFVLLSPGLFYVVALASIPTLPSIPAKSSQFDSESWRLHGGAGLPYATGRNPPMVMERLNPWQYALHTLFGCTHPMRWSADIHECVYYFKGFMGAYSAADRHFRGERSFAEMSQFDDWKMIALSIWTTRNGTAQEVAAYVAAPQVN